MDAIDILGSLFGNRKRQPKSGSGPSIDRSRRAPQNAPSPSRPPSADEIDREAAELEDLLNVATGSQSRSSGRARTTTPSAAPVTTRRGPSQTPTSPQPTGRGGAPPTSHRSENDRATVLIRAMVNAAKSDGSVDRTEQQAIMDRLQSPSQDAIDFLRQEFDRPLDVGEFAASVPVGMEQQVYMMSLMAINLDSGAEAKYLVALSDALRLSTDVREQIHQRLGAPSVY